MSKVPGSGGGGSTQGNPVLNKHLQTPQPNVERTHTTRDGGVPLSGGDGWPSMYDMAREMTSGKWGESPKGKKSR